VKKQTAKTKTKTKKGKKKIVSSQTNDVKQTLDFRGIEKRKVPDGVSVFDLIMPWKLDINNQKLTENEI
jgi:hypothetical protein